MNGKAHSSRRVGFALELTVGRSDTAASGFVQRQVNSSRRVAFGLGLVACFIAGLLHGACFGIASLAAANLIGQAK